MKPRHLFIADGAMSTLLGLAFMRAMLVFDVGGIILGVPHAYSGFVKPVGR